MITCHRPSTWILIPLLAALTLVACGAQEPFDEQQPSLEDLANNLRSPVDITDIESFRVMTETRAEPVEAFSWPIDIAWNVEVISDPTVVRLTMSNPDPEAKPGDPDEMTLIIVDNMVWVKDGDAWQVEDIDIYDFDFAAWTRDAFLNLSSGSTPGSSEQILLAEILESAEVLGRDTLNGYPVTHVRLSTEAVLSAMSRAYDETAKRAEEVNCSELLEKFGASDIDSSQTQISLEEYEQISLCLSDNLTAPPADYITFYEVDLWMADAGFIMKMEDHIVLTQYPFYTLALDEGETVSISNTMEITSINEPITIEIPTAEQS